MSSYCFLTFDVEEWFQVENLKSVIPPSEWEDKKSTVEQNINKVLAILDRYCIRSTFFVLGWVAEQNPGLIKKIHAAGHEVASHGYAHERVNIGNEKEVFFDLKKSKNILENIINDSVIGYRAPNFSINDNVLRFLKRLEFVYDSSYNPFRLNPRYGELKRLGQKVAFGCYKTFYGIYEIPLSCYHFKYLQVPIAGGAYFRIIPLWIFKQVVKKKIRQEPLYNFYLHPWELEPEQQKVKNIRWDYRFRHYYGLHRTAEKLEKLIIYLKVINCKFLTIKDYIKNVQEEERKKKFDT